MQGTEKSKKNPHKGTDSQVAAVIEVLRQLGQPILQPIRWRPSDSGDCVRPGLEMSVLSILSGPCSSQKEGARLN